MAYEANPEEVTGSPSGILQVEDTVADSLQGASGGRDTAAVHIFGPRSSLTMQEPPSAESPHGAGYLTGNPAFPVIVLLCFMGYCLLISRFKGYFAEALGIFRGGSSADKLRDTQNSVFDRFIRSSLSLFSLMLAVMVVKCADLAAGERIAALLPQWSVGLAGIGVWAVLVLIWLFQGVLLRAAGYLTMSVDFTNALIGIRKMVFATGCVSFVPVMLILSMWDGMSAWTFSLLLTILIGCVLIILLVRSYILFMGQNISILYWILYLCGVEIFPVSFIVVLVKRYMIL